MEDMMNKTVDARGLTCPQPVILTKRAMEADGDAVLTTIVDNNAAKENVSKLAASQGYQFEVETINNEFHIIMSRGKAIENICADIPSVAVLITSRYFGTGAEELGRVLMRSFLYSLNEMNGKVKTIVFMNSGVYLTSQDSELLDLLQNLADQGVDLLSCGTCLDYYGLKDKLALGSITNMYTALEIMTGAGTAITI